MSADGGILKPRPRTWAVKHDWAHFGHTRKAAPSGERGAESRRQDLPHPGLALQRSGRVRRLAGSRAAWVTTGRSHSNGLPDWHRISINQEAAWED